MPVDPTNEYADQAHESTIDTGRPYTCHNRPPVAPFIQAFQDGWHRTPEQIAIIEHRNQDMLAAARQPIARPR